MYRSQVRAHRSINSCKETIVLETSLLLSILDLNSQAGDFFQHVPVKVPEEACWTFLVHVVEQIVEINWEVID